MRHNIFALMGALCVFAAACGGDDNNANNATPKDMSQAQKDMSVERDMGKTTPDMADKPDMKAMVDMAPKVDMAPVEDMADMAPVEDMAPVGGATLKGVISRSAPPDNSVGGDAKGDIYIGLFDQSPLMGFGMVNPNAMVVARVIVPNSDLSAQGATISYTLEGVPPRQEPYYIVAFLDDNSSVNAADPSSAAPDKGDLVALKSLIPPSFETVEIKTATEHTTNIDLSAAMPF